MRVQAFDPRRSYQLGPAEELCTMSGSSFLLADTGTGKTVVGAIEIGRILQSGKIALVVTPEAHLTSQWQAVLLRSLNVKESEIFICSGESLTDRKRGAMMKEGIKIIIATPEALTRDIAAASPRIDLSRVGRAILDEADLIEGRTDYASLNKQLLEHRVRRTLMSATVASGYKKSKDKLASFGITIGDLVVMRGRKGKLYDQTFRLPLTPDILYPAQKILESYRTCLLDIQSRLDKLTRSSGPSSRAAQSVFDEVRKAHEESLENKREKAPPARENTATGGPSSFNLSNSRGDSLGPASRIITPSSITVREFLGREAEPPSQKVMKNLYGRVTQLSSSPLKSSSHYSEQTKEWRMVRSKAAELQHIGRMYHLITSSKVAFIDFAARHFGDTVSPIPRKQLLFVTRAFVLCREELNAVLKKEGEVGLRISKEIDAASPMISRLQSLPAPHKVRAIMEDIGYLCSEKLARGDPDFSKLRELQSELHSWCIAYQRLVGTPLYDQQGRFRMWQGSRGEFSNAGITASIFQKRSGEVTATYKTGVKSHRDGRKVVDLTEMEPSYFQTRIYREDPKIKEAIRAVAWGLEAPYDKTNPPARPLDPLYYSSLFAHGAWAAVAMDFPKEYGSSERDFILHPQLIRSRFLEDALFDTAKRPLSRYVDSPKDGVLHGLPVEGHLRLAANSFGGRILKGQRSFMYIASPVLAWFQATRIEALHMTSRDGQSIPEVEASVLLGKKALSPKERTKHLDRFRKDNDGQRKTIVTNKTRGTDVPNVDEAVMYVPLADIRALHQFQGRTKASRGAETSSVEEVRVTGMIHKGTPEERSLDIAERRYRHMLRALERLRVESEAARA